MIWTLNDATEVGTSLWNWEFAFLETVLILGTLQLNDLRWPVFQDTQYDDTLALDNDEGVQFRG